MAVCLRRRTRNDGGVFTTAVRPAVTFCASALVSVLVFPVIKLNGSQFFACGQCQLRCGAIEINLLLQERVTAVLACGLDDDRVLACLDQLAGVILAVPLEG